MTGTEFGFKGIPPELDEVGGIPRIRELMTATVTDGPLEAPVPKPQRYVKSSILSIIKGTHSLKIGFDFRHQDNEWVDLMNRTVAYGFQGGFHK